MAKRKHRHRRQRDGVVGSALRPVAWSAALGAAMAAAVGSPAYAEAPAVTYAEPSRPGNVPDAGARPQPVGPVELPSSLNNTGTPFVPVSPVTSGLDPLAQQITAAETEVASLGEQLKQLAIEREQIETELAAVTAAWRDATAALHEAEVSAESAVEEAYKRAAELPPGGIGSDLRGLGALSPLQKTESSGSEATQAEQLRRAREAEQTAFRAKQDVETRKRDADARYVSLQATYKQREQALLDLRKRNATQLAAIEAEREAQEQRLGAGYLNGGSVDGMAAHPRALQAVRFALAQLGEPYLWGAEGPSRWDCSGLMWGAYKAAKPPLTLPRVSRAQYQGTKAREVSPNALLPGDLLFFSSSRTDASKIHHVGMYIGGGRMVHAPTTGDVVKISTVWWSRFFAATRPIGAVQAPAQSGGGTTTNPTPTPTRSTPGPGSTTKPPGPTPTKTKTPQPGPTGTVTPTPGPTTPEPDPTTNAPDPAPPPSPDPPAEPSPAGQQESSPTAGADGNATPAATSS